MSLATRCTSCGTIFRVVQDQLRVSEGWVRCGRCDAVFLATESLFDLDREAAPAWSATEPPPVPAPTTAPLKAEETTASAAAAEPERSDRPASAEATLRALSAAAAASRVSVDARAPAGADAIVMTPERPKPSAAAEPLGAIDPAPASPPEVPAPAFIERARRQAFWQRGRVRALLGVATLGLLALLLLQATQQFSEIAAARWAALRPVLTPWCRATGCSLAAPRRIDAILVESTALAPAPGTGALQLSVALRNRASHAVALPSIDLSLTDPTGRLIARRTLQPQDFRVGATELTGRAELPLRVLLAAGDEHVSGYTVEIFYP